MASSSRRPDDQTPVGRFVADMARDLTLSHNAADERTRRQLQRLVEWATNEGVALNRELILDPDTIERFVEVALVEDRSQATYRAVLRRVGPRLTRKAPWEPRPEAIPRRSLVAPYTDAEIELLRDDAGEQPTKSRRRAAAAFLALGLGAGLDGRWVSRVTAGDVIRHGRAVLVSVGHPAARRVVVRADWEDDVLQLAATARSQFLVGGTSASRHRTAHLTENLVVPTDHPRLLPARLRSTWLLWHVATGTRLPELCRAAGLKGPGALTDLLEYIPPLDDPEAVRMLRGRG
ncbi:MAG: hypothetical protein WAL04_00705 [Acidimicrobiales bacterium]